MTANAGILCSLHNREMHEDVHEGTPMGRLLCPEPGCTSILAHSTIAAVRDLDWCEENGMTAPGWQTIEVKR